MSARRLLLGTNDADLVRELQEHPFEPIAETSPYSPPRATIDPDPSKSWLGRAWPVIKTHKGIWSLSLVMSFVALFSQVQIPRYIGNAITDSLPTVGHTTDLKPLTGFATLIFIAVVGRTGSGKTTAGRLLNRSYDVSEGQLLIDGRDVRDYTLESLRAQVGFVFDEPFLFSISIRDNIAYGKPGATMEEIIAAARAADADEFIVRLRDGYGTVVGERGYTLSGGQRQRMAIARTLLVNPPVLVLDDATSAIDVQVEQRIHASLLELMADRTTLIIAHRLATISLADRVVLVENGHVVASGRHQELLRDDPRYAEVLAHVVEEAPQEPGQ